MQEDVLDQYYSTCLAVPYSDVLAFVLLSQSWKVFAVPEIDFTEIQSKPSELLLILESFIFMIGQKKNKLLSLRKDFC